jgi:hydrogenase expression/formation protein HypC
MCLGIPGKVVEIHEETRGSTALTGTVEFGGIRKDICLAYVPDVEVGEYVIVHVGFAISKMDEAEAQEVFELLKEMDELAEFGVGGQSPPGDEKPAREPGL